MKNISYKGISFKKLSTVTLVIIAFSALLLGTGCGGFSSIPTPTPTATVEPTRTVTPTRTTTRTRTPTFTPTTDPLYTEMLTLVDEMKDLGLIETTDGTFHRLDDFTDRFAMNGYFDYVIIDDDPTDFILTSDIWWDTSTNSANTFWTGCGFLFRYYDDYNFYGVIFDADGYASMFRWVGYPSFLNYGYWGKVPLHEGSVKLTIVAVEHHFTFFVNGVKALQIHDERVASGQLAYLIGSGTNLEPGTICKWTNVAYWELP
jgi:hypothetical protein